MDNILLDHLPTLHDAVRQPVFGVNYNYNPLIRFMRNLERRCLITENLTIDEYYRYKQFYIDKFADDICYLLKITAMRDILNMPRITDIKDIHREFYGIKRIINDYLWM